MLRQLRKTGLDYEIITAIEGRDLDLTDTSLIAPNWIGRCQFWPGAAGCSLSHLKVYKKVLSDGADRALVLEDDVLLPPHLDSLVDSIAPLMDGAEVVLLHYVSPFSAERGIPLRLSKQSALALPPSSALAEPFDVMDVSASGAYLITRDACERMSQAVLPIRVQIDDWGFFFKAGAFDRVRCVVPMPVWINVGFRTTIDHNPSGSLQTRIREAAIKIPLLSQALMHRRQRILNRMTRVELVDIER
jgi:glycosyl transferase, family 25